MSWGELVRSLLEARGESVNAFATRIGYNQGNLTRCIQGRAPVPMARLAAWADALGLEGDQRRQFEEAAAMTHAPPIVQHRVERMEEELIRLREVAREFLGIMRVAEVAPADQERARSAARAYLATLGDQVQDAAEVGQQPVAAVEPVSYGRPRRRRKG